MVRWHLAYLTFISDYGTDIAACLLAESMEARSSVTVTAHDGEYVTLKFHISENLTDMLHFSTSSVWQATWRKSDLCRMRYFNGKTMLHFMCSAKSSIGDIERLLEVGMDIHAEDEGGLTPLDHLCIFGMSDHIAALIEKRICAWAHDIFSWLRMAGNPKSSACCSLLDYARTLGRAMEQLPCICYGETYLTHHSTDCSMSIYITARLFCLKLAQIQTPKTIKGLSPLRDAIVSCVRKKCTWSGTEADAVSELLRRSTDEQARACCRQLLSYQPWTKLEEKWTEMVSRLGVHGC